MSVTRYLPLILLLFLFMGCEPEPAEPPSHAAPTLESIVTLPSLTGTAPEQPRWSPDSRQLVFLWNEHGMPYRDLWLTRVGQPSPVRLTHFAPAPGDVPPRLEEGRLDTLQARIRERAQRGVSEVRWDPEGDWLYYTYQGRLERIRPDGEGQSLVYEGESGVSRLRFSPDGRWLAFLSGGDLWLKNRVEGGIRPATDLAKTGPGQVALGAFVRPDRYVASYEWSPSSDAIALQLIDQRTVRKVPFPSYLHDEPILHHVRRPYPGDTDLIRRVALLTVPDTELKLLETPEPNRRLILEMAWSPDGRSLMIMQGADVAEDRWIMKASADGTRLETLWHDHRPQRIYPVFRAVWSASGDEIYFIGDHEAYYRLYAIAAESGADRAEARRLSGDYDVAGERGPAWLDVAPDGTIYLQSTEYSPHERHVHRLLPEENGTQRLTRLPGTHEPVLSPDGNYLALIHSSDVRPAELYLLRTDGESDEQRVTHSPLPEFNDYDWIPARYVRFPSRDGDYEIHARIVEPPDMQAGKRYPVIIGNIYSDTVRNIWQSDRPTSTLQQQMALSDGYIAVQVDVRGSIGYGVAFREAFQGDWGRGDLEDLHAAVEYLSTLPHVDPERIGIWGNSYGGLMVLSGLFRKPGLFAAGVAGAPAVDVWHFTGFDQHLTRRPDTHPEIFEQGSLMDLGEDLADPLLIIHGLHDDIVPLKTTLMLSEKLMLLGKEFELDIVHDSGHWWAAQEHYALYTFRRLVDFFHRHMPPGPRDEEE